MATKPTDNQNPPGAPDRPPRGSAAASAAAAGAAVEAAVEEVADEVAETIEEVGELSARIARGTVLGILGYLGEVTVLIGQALRSLRHGVHLGDLARQMAMIGVDSIPIALLTVGFSGAVLSLYSVRTLSDFGASNLVGGIVGLSIVRETGPILTGVVLAARAGSAMTAEIGSMKVSEQIDALRSMAISPVAYLVTPRLLACLLMLPVVALFADLAGVTGGMLVASPLGVPATAYTQSLRQLMEPDGSDITKGLIKTIVFGAIIAAVGCREGLQTEGGATGVGQSTTRSVVLSIVLIFFANFFLSFLMFGGRFL